MILHSPASASTTGGSSRSGSSSSSSGATPTPSTSVSAPVQAPKEGVLYQLGSYNCTSTITLNYLTGIFNDFLEATSTTTDASFTYLLLNIHAAASWQHPNEPAQQPAGGVLPRAAGNLLSNVMKGNLSDQLYTPSKLANERAKLSNSWNNVDADNKPRGGYYTVEGANSNDPSSADGWPDEAYAQFSKFYRLIAIFGTVDPQMGDYNMSLDADTIFPSETISFQPDVSFSSSGSLSEGCLFDAFDKTVTPQRNSSFAVGVVPPTLSVSSNPDLFSPIPLISNLTACGISPILNHSLANTTADKNPLPYAAFTHSYLWTWAPGEPLNATDASTSGATGNRCAAAYTEGEWSGRWHVVDCNTPLRIACQDPSSPTPGASPPPRNLRRRNQRVRLPSTFSVPHTPLENAHLLSAARAALSSTAPTSTPLPS
ncbi:Maintenance of telomere capping protein 6 [Didymosphaeria variabile]|uniref:Maintenance of telomere capping protein 6 n=1 Tax=Didymosphaeria variabile TaxID=1932322 RepID=A0A9W8XKZ4_9PLEO|nr:Maintenance of telomere capping protein 6 [Didymosphaeria variabile]KAJ4353501.1 Maintenance of telomere capping protein 6 [Didymosphaeria variabile]